MDDSNLNLPFRLSSSRPTRPTSTRSVGAKANQTRDAPRVHTENYLKPTRTDDYFVSSDMRRYIVSGRDPRPPAASTKLAASVRRDAEALRYGYANWKTSRVKGGRADIFEYAATKHGKDCRSQKMRILYRVLKRVAQDLQWHLVDGLPASNFDKFTILAAAVTALRVLKPKEYFVKECVHAQRKFRVPTNCTACVGPPCVERANLLVFKDSIGLFSGTVKGPRGAGNGEDLRQSYNLHMAAEIKSLREQGYEIETLRR
eukprot:Rmarinus@m.28418